MSNKTLYVSDEDERIWSKAQKIGERGGGSLSKVVSAALQEYVCSLEAEAADEDDLTARAEQRVYDRDLVARIRAFVRRHGVDDVSWAFGRALVVEGASRSRAATKAQTTLGREGREAAARKAVASKGVEGLQRAARKAWATRNVQAKT